MATTFVETPNFDSISNEEKINNKLNGNREKTRYRINWMHAIMLTATPSLALYGFLTTPLKLPTFIFSVIVYFWTGMGITAGYHRLFSHRAYKASWIVRALLIFGGAAAFEGSCKWWSRNHRAHHRYTDTDKDPYNVRKGFWWAHLGWMLVHQDFTRCGTADITDLRNDPLVEFQHKYYIAIASSLGIYFTTLLPGLLWGDYWGGFFYATMARIVFVHHATFFVNSLAHTFGERSFSDLHSAEDSIITAVLSLGEGYHNFHHEFPQDYRNAIKFWQYDPTKWLIWALSLVGLAYQLKITSTNEICKAKFQVEQRTLDREQSKLNYGPNFDILPKMSKPEFKRQVAAGSQLVIVDGRVHDVSKFVEEHPGGRLTLLKYVGEDVTDLFYGANGNHVHSKGALKFLEAMRTAILD